MSSGKGIRLNNIEVKRVNRNSILQYMLNAEAVTKNTIAEEIHLSIPTVTQGLNDLKELGLVRDEGPLESIGGRKAMSYQCIKDAKVSVGIDITANHVNVVIVNLSKEILYSKRVRIKLHDTKESYDELKGIIRDAIGENKLSTDSILGLGISLPAIVDETGTKVYAMHEEMKISYNLYAMVSEWFEFPILLGNDANSAGKAEITFSKIENDTVYMFISQTVGGAIIIEGKVFYGKLRRSGEFGHMTLYPAGAQCFCGRKGCINAYCSTKILSDHTNEDLNEFFEKVGENNQVCKDIWNRYLNDLSLAIHNLYMAFDSDIIIGGYLGPFIEPHLESLRERVQKMENYVMDATFIRAAKLKHEASAVGVAAIFIDQFIDEI